MHFRVPSALVSRLRTPFFACLTAACLLAGCSNPGAATDGGAAADVDGEDAGPGDDAGGDCCPPDGSDPLDGGDHAPDGGDPQDGGDQAPDGGQSTGCGQAPGANDEFWTLTHDGLERSFHVHLPAGYDHERPTPLVVSLHGRNVNAQTQMMISGLLELADAEGFVVVHPEGVGDTWNAGLCCDPAMSSGVDDVGFLAAMLDDLEAALCVDPRRVYATGMSNGGFMAHRLACQLTERVAAIASVAGPKAYFGCEPSRPVPVFHFHGKEDKLVPYTGFLGQVSVADTVDFWTGHNGCGAESTVFLEQDEVLCEEWTGCRAGATVRLCTIEGGGHQWPGGFTIPGLGYNTQVISASQMLWDFFKAHPRP